MDILKIILAKVPPIMAPSTAALGLFWGYGHRWLEPLAKHTSALWWNIWMCLFTGLFVTLIIVFIVSFIWFLRIVSYEKELLISQQETSKHQAYAQKEIEEMRRVNELRR